MADEYIKRSDAFTVIERFNGYLDDDMQYRIKFMLNRDCPAADVREVVRGKWILVTNGRGGSECNQCHAYAPSYQCGVEYKANYCPNCGAKMEGKDG